MRTHCYVGKLPCGCTGGAVVDDPERKEHTATCVSDLIAAGCTVTRETIEAFKADPSPLGCECGQKTLELGL